MDPARFVATATQLIKRIVRQTQFVNGQFLTGGPERFMCVVILHGKKEEFVVFASYNLVNTLNV